jgi:TPR repeat protein
MQSFGAKSGYAAGEMKARARISVCGWLLMAALVLAGPALAGFDEGRAAYKAGDYATALAEWRPAAEGGHARAQYAFGNLYNEGKGVAHDAAVAAEWWQKAAARNHAQAQFALGVLYSSGSGTAKDNIAAHM